MALIDWTADLGTGIGSIDGQHEKLISYINVLHEAMRTGKGHEVLGKVLNELTAYTITHFSNEERLMTAHGFPGYAAHKKEHEEFTQKVMKLNDDFRKGKYLITIEIMQFLKEWLVTHIKGTDRQYAPFLLAKGVS